MNGIISDCSDYLTLIFPQWNKTAVAKSAYKEVNENNVGVEKVPIKTLLGFYETIVTDVLKYYMLHDKPIEDDTMQRWVNASSFENSEDTKEKITAEDSTMGPSRSIFIRELNEVASHLQVEIDQKCFRTDRPDMLDLDKVKSTNMKLLSDEKNLLDRLRKGKEVAIAEKEKKLREQIVRDRLQAKHIYG